MMFETIKKMLNKTNEEDDMQNRQIAVQNTLDFLKKNMPNQVNEKKREE